MKNSAVDEKDTDDWEQIKNWVGGGNKDTKHPLHQELDRIKQRQPENFDDGGIAGDQIGPVPPGGPVQGAPVDPSQLPGVQPTAAPVSAPAPGPGTAAMDSNYGGQANSILGGITPDAINQLMQSLNKSNQVAQIGAGVAGVGDAIAKGVGRTDQNRMAETEGNIKNKEEQALKVPGQMAEIGKEKYGLTKEISADDPKSMRSFVAQNANAPLLKQLGFSSKELKLMPASLIDGIRGGAITAEDARAQLENTAAYRNAALGLQGATLEATKEHEKAEENVASQGRQTEAAKQVEDRGAWRRVLDAIPGTSGHKAEKTLEAIASPDSQPKAFDSVEEAESAGLPPGTRVMINGRSGTVQ